MDELKLVLGVSLEDGDWQMEFVVPQEIGTALLMDKTFEPMKRQLR